MSFFKTEGQEGKTVCFWGLVLVGGRGHKERMKKRANKVEVLHTHVWKWNNETCWVSSKKGGREVKEKDGGGESKIYFNHFYKCHNVPPEHLL
jgi:hypothetical protein